MRRFALASVLLLAGCASQTASADLRATAADVGGEPCSLWGESGAVEGRRITEETFSFCVPASWTRVGARRWESNGFIRWDPTERAATLTRQRTSRRRNVELAQNSPLEQELLRIGERDASIFRRQVDGKYFTGLNFQQERLTFEGEAMSLAESTLQLAIYRSVRFASRAR